MNKSVWRLFTDATALIEDMHGISVEGQAQDVSSDMARVLVGNLLSGVRRLDRTAQRIIAALEAGA